MQNQTNETTLTASSDAQAAEPVLANEHPPAQLTLIATKGETIYAATDYWIEGGQLFYTLRSGANGALDLNRLDWDSTTQLNSQRGITVTLRTRPRVP